LSEEDYGALALLDTVIEEREERLSEDDVAQILTIIRETLGSKGRTGSVG
jgi:ribosomal protein L29